jgi:phage gp29-like protein
MKLASKVTKSSPSSRGKSRIANAPVKAPKQKKDSVVGADRVLLYLRSRFNPIRRLTPELLSVYMDRSKVGFLRELALVWDAVQERDDKIKLASGLRQKAVARFDYQIEHVDGLTTGEKAKAEEHKATLEYFFGNLTCTKAIDENERGGVKMMVRQMMDAVGSKYSVHEIVWKPQADGDLTAEVRWTPLWFFENLTGKLRYLAMEGQTYGVDLDEGGWMVSVGEGLMYASLIAYIFKVLPLRDWLTLSERAGMPAIVGKTPSTPGSAQYEAMLTALESLGREYIALMNMTDVIEKIDLGAVDAEKTYAPLVERMDRAIVALWRGGDLSTMSSGKQSQGHGSQRQDEEADTILDDDVENIDETIHQYLSRYVIEYVHGDDRPLARYKTVVPPDRATAQDIATDQFLVSVAPPGEGLSWEDALKRYGRTPAQKGDKLLIAPAQPEQLPPNLGNACAGAFKRLANVRTAYQPAGLNSLLNSLGQHIAQASAETQKPILDWIERLDEASEANFAAECQAFINEMPKLLEPTDADAQAVEGWQEALGTMLINGLTH